MTSKFRKIFLLSLLSTPFLTTNTWSMNLHYSEYGGNWYLAAGAGYSMYKMGSNNYINPGPGWPDDYYYRNSIHNGSFVDITGGYVWTHCAEYLTALMVGVNYTRAFQGKVDGFINQYNLGAFHNYSYSFDFSRQNLFFIAKADLLNINGFMPYITIGTGPSFNRASSYEELPLENVTPRCSPEYGTASHNDWAYMIGLGVDYMLQDDIWMGLEYNFAYFGTVRTGYGTPRPMVTGVDYSTQRLSHQLKANTVLINFTYLLNYV